MRARPTSPPLLQPSALHCALLVAGSLVLSGCGAASPAKADAPPPSDASVDSAQSAQSAQSDLDKGEWRITELFGPAGGVAHSEAPAASAAPTAPAAPPQPGVGQTTTKAAELSGGDSNNKPADACTIACSALASMERAARHLCEMSGPDEDRCTSARERVRNANDRVAAHCTCGI